MHVEPTVIIAVAGLITTALAPVAQGRISANNELRRWRREVAADVYTDALATAEVAEQFAESTRDPIWSSGRKHPEIKHTDLITARLRLIGPAGVVNAWTEFVTSRGAFSFHLSENYPGLGVDWNEAVPEDDPQYVKLTRAIAKVRSSIADAFA
jgi:hypothetical protein